MSDSPAGFGLPINQNPKEPIHWWMPDDKKACERNNKYGSTGFCGDRVVTDEQMREHGICSNCLFEVMIAAEVLGIPERMRNKMVVAIQTPAFGRR